MSQTIPLSPPDVTEWVVGRLRAVLPAGVVVGDRRQPVTGAERQVVVRADLGGRTPAQIARYCRVGLTVWALNARGDAETDAGFDLANAANRALEAASGVSWWLHAETDTGPIRDVDDQSLREFHYSVVLAEIAAT